jgi:hypothetical protein
MAEGRIRKAESDRPAEKDEKNGAAGAQESFSSGSERVSAAKLALRTLS